MQFLFGVRIGLRLLLALACDLTCASRAAWSAEACLLRLDALEADLLVDFSSDVRSLKPAPRPHTHNTRVFQETTYRPDGIMRASRVLSVPCLFRYFLISPALWQSLVTWLSALPWCSLCDVLRLRDDREHGEHSAAAFERAAMLVPSLVAMVLHLGVCFGVGLVCT